MLCFHCGRSNLFVMMLIICNAPIPFQKLDEESVLLMMCVRIATMVRREVVSYLDYLCVKCFSRNLLLRTDV